MSKEKKIKVKDGAKWCIHIFASLGIYALLSFIILSMHDSIIGDDVMLLLSLFLLLVMLGYFIFSFKISNKYVSITEYREMRKDTYESYLRQELAKQDFSEKEINEILKDRPLGKLLQQEQAPEEITNENPIKDLKEDFKITKEYITKQGLGMYADSESKQVAIINPDKSITYVDFKNIYSYETKTLDYGSGNTATPPPLDF